MLHTRWGRPIHLDELFAGRDDITLGRNSGNALVLSSKLAATAKCDIPDGLVLQLSRLHARMALKDGRLQIQDLGTLNGTYVNNARLPPQTWRVLSEKDTVTLGGSDPLALDGVVHKNPWHFTVQRLQEFLASRPRGGALVPGSHPSSAATGNATTIAAGPGREVYSFGQASQVALPRIDRSTEVIDLTLDDSPPAAKRPRHAPPPAEQPAAQPAEPAAPAQDSGLNKLLLEETQCPICHEPFVGATCVTPCSHGHCGPCLLEWLEANAANPTCPMCRVACTGPPVRNVALDNLAAAAAARLPAADRAEFERRKKEWEATRQVSEAKLKAMGRVGGSNPMAAALGALQGMLPMGMMMMGEGAPPAMARRPIPPARTRIAPAPASQSYRAQYASGGEMCVRCQTRCERGALVMGVATGSGGRRGRSQGSYSWHHFDCFPAGLYAAAAAVGVENMRGLRPVDASRLRDRLSGMAG